MKHALLLALALLLPSPALATPWFDQRWAERLVARTFPDYWDWIREVRAVDRDRYADLLQQGRTMALQREWYPEVVEAWETHFYALMAYRELTRAWAADPAHRGESERQALVAAAEDVHLAHLELLDAQLNVTLARCEQLELQIADREENYQTYALETVEGSIGAR